jgi:hypothetical protein
MWWRELPNQRSLEYARYIYSTIPLRCKSSFTVVSVIVDHTCST